MKRAFLLFALALLATHAHAHLNHVQFATIDEVESKLRVRYRMSADMFMSNLDAEIKSGRMRAEIKQQPLDKIIRQYFKSHLALVIENKQRDAQSVAFSRDEKTGDWIADFLFDVPAPGTEIVLLCDAFLENNPRTQTLASIDWRGEKTMFHFRKGNERYTLGSSLHPAEVQLQAANSATLDDFLEGLARALTGYTLLIAGALVYFVLGRLLLKWPKFVVTFLLVAVTAVLTHESLAHLSAASQIGFVLGWLTVAATGLAISRAGLQPA